MEASDKKISVLELPISDKVVLDDPISNGFRFGVSGTGVPDTGTTGVSGTGVSEKEITERGFINIRVSDKGI